MQAKTKVAHIKSLLTEIGIDPGRVDMYNLSAAMGTRWAEICTEFTERVQHLGPSPVWFADQRRKKEG